MAEVKQVYFYGILEEKFGRGPFMFAADRLQFIFRGLALQFPDLPQFIREHEWTIVYNSNGTPIVVQPQALEMSLQGVDDIHIFPSIQGEIVVAGAALLMGGVAGMVAFGATATAFTLFGMATTWGTIAGWGLCLVLTGLAGMLAPSASVDNMAGERPDERPSFLFNGAVNVGEQGGPVPLVYGEFQVGSTVISAGIEVEAA